MARYSEEHKAAVLKKLLPPQNHTVAAVSAEEGISDVTPVQLAETVSATRSACARS